MSIQQLIFEFRVSRLLETGASAIHTYEVQSLMDQTGLLLLAHYLLHLLRRVSEASAYRTDASSGRASRTRRG